MALEGNGQRPSHRGDGYRQSDEMYTLNTTEVHGVAYGFKPTQGAKALGIGFEEETAPTVLAGQMGGY